MFRKISFIFAFMTIVSMNLYAACVKATGGSTSSNSECLNYCVNQASCSGSGNMTNGKVCRRNSNNQPVCVCGNAPVSSGNHPGIGTTCS